MKPFGEELRISGNRNGEETQMLSFIRRFHRDQDGAAMVEYALLVALIALVAIVGVSFTGTSINAQFTKIGCKIANPQAACTATP